MFVIVTYDVKVKRVNKVLKYCRQYLNHVQNSVFEGNLTKKQLKTMQEGLSKILFANEDSCMIYIMESTKYCHKECYGIHDCKSDILYDK